MGLVETKRTIAEKPLLWFGVGIVVLSLIALSVVLVLKKDSSEKGEVLAVVGEDAIYKKDLNERIYGLEFSGTVENPPEIPIEKKKYLLDSLIQAKIAEKEAPSLGVSVSDDEVNKAVEDRIGDYFEEYTIYQKEITKKALKDELLLEKVLEKSISLREGKFFICRFDYSYERMRDLTKPENQKKTEEDKKYSEKLCTDLYNDVKSNKITFEQAMEKAKADKVIGESVWGSTYDIAVEFTKEDYEKRLYFTESVNMYDFLSTLKENETSSPTLISLKNDEDQNKSRESFYMVAKITSSNDSEYKNQEDWFSGMKNKYKVEYKVNY